MLIKHRYIVAIIVFFFFSYSKTYGQSFPFVITVDVPDTLFVGDVIMNPLEASYIDGTLSPASKQNSQYLWSGSIRTMHLLR